MLNFTLFFPGGDTLVLHLIRYCIKHPSISTYLAIDFSRPPALVTRDLYIPAKHMDQLTLTEAQLIVSLCLVVIQRPAHPRPTLLSKKKRKE